VVRRGGYVIYLLKSLRHTQSTRDTERKVHATTPHTTPHTPHNTTERHPHFFLSPPPLVIKNFFYLSIQNGSHEKVQLYSQN
jgi:hypothetical protein